MAAGSVAVAGQVGGDMPVRVAGCGAALRPLSDTPLVVSGVRAVVVRVVLGVGGLLQLQGQQPGVLHARGEHPEAGLALAAFHPPARNPSR